MHHAVHASYIYKCAEICNIRNLAHHYFLQFRLERDNIKNNFIMARSISGDDYSFSYFIYFQNINYYTNFLVYVSFILCFYLSYKRSIQFLSKFSRWNPYVILHFYLIKHFFTSQLILHIFPGAVQDIFLIFS